MTIKWSEQAGRELVRTADYIQLEFGSRARTYFIRSIRKTTTLLKNNPNLGPVERFLLEEPVLYRSVVVGHLNKIIYFVHGDVIEIVDLWDARREPKDQASRTNKRQ